MVHGQLIAGGQVGKLTYKQLRALERMDAKKAKQQKVLELTKSAIEAAGEIGHGIMQGTVTGPIAMVLLLSATYKGWTPIVADGFNALAAAIFSAWYNGGGKNILIPPSPQLTVAPAPPGPPQIRSAEAKYCIKIWHGAAAGGWVESCWTTEAERNGAFAIAAAAGNEVILEDPITKG